MSFEFSLILLFSNLGFAFFATKLYTVAQFVDGSAEAAFANGSCAFSHTLIIIHEKLNLFLAQCRNVANTKRWICILPVAAIEGEWGKR